LRINPDEFDQLRLCQIRPPGDCHAGFTVKGRGRTWPVASWGDTPVKERVNVRGWIPLLDQMADEFLIWQPQGGSFCVHGDRAAYRLERDLPEVVFLWLEVHRLMVMPPRAADARRALEA
jgi:hypothetical protein